MDALFLGYQFLRNLLVEVNHNLNVQQIIDLLYTLYDVDLVKPLNQKFTQNVSFPYSCRNFACKKKAGKSYHTLLGV